MYKLLQYIVLIGICGNALGENVPDSNDIAPLGYDVKSQATYTYIKPVAYPFSQGKTENSQADSASHEIQVADWIAALELRITQRKGLSVSDSWVRDGSLFVKFEDGSYAVALSGNLPGDLLMGSEPDDHPEVVLGGIDSFIANSESHPDESIDAGLNVYIGQDSHVSSGYPDIVDGKFSSMYVGIDPVSGWGNMWTFVRPDSFSIAWTITNATLELPIASSFGDGSTWTMGVWVVADGGANYWTEEAITWNNKPAYGDLQSSEIVAAALTSNYYKYLDITSIAQQWNNQTHDQNGLMIAPSEAVSGQYAEITSSEGGAGPVMTLEYTLNTSDDAYEENDTLGTAYNLSGWEQVWLHLINGYGRQYDEDWFEIFVSSGYERVLVDLIFTDAEGDIDVALYDSAGVELVSSSSTSNDEYIDFTVSGGGTYYLRVYFGNQGNLYNLRWDNIPPTTQIPNPPAAIAATSITTSSFQANWNSSSGATGYRLDVSTSSTFVSFVSGYNNLDVGNVTLTSVTGLSSSTTYYYRVRAYNGSGNSGNSNSIIVMTSEDPTLDVIFSSSFEDP